MSVLRKYFYTLVALMVFYAAILAMGSFAASLTPTSPTIHSTYTSKTLSALVDTTKNTINDSLSSLRPFVIKLNSLRSHTGSNKVVSILHLGDSHIQAGYLGERLRWLFQRDFGNAGRGVITPLKLLRTNGPADYSISSPNNWIGFRCIDNKGHIIGVTGAVIETASPEFEINIASREEFCLVRALHDSVAPLLVEPQELSTGFSCDQESTETSTTILLNKPVTNISLKGHVTDDYPKPAYYGFSLENGHSGVLLHSIGINGASFVHYNANRNIIGDARDLAPDLVIVSLGTNDCYDNHFNPDYTYSQIDNLVRQIHQMDALVPILLVTPMECCSRRRISRGRMAYVPNVNVGKMAHVIIQYAKDKGIPYWDMYNAAGGAGANARWNATGIMARDRIHLSVDGYYLQAEMLYKAFVNYYNAKIQ